MCRIHVFDSLNCMLNSQTLGKGAVILNPGYQGGRFRQGHVFSSTLWGYENIKSNFYRVRKYLA